jgi:outer membrane lipoprotein-sorting protein
MLWMGLLFLVPFACAQQSNAYGPQNYSAVMVIHNGKKIQQMFMDKRGMKLRTSMQTSKGKTAFTQIVLLDQRTAYMVLPQMCMQSELKDLPPVGVLEEAQQAHTKITDLGPETITVGGKSYACEHRRVLYTDAQGKQYVSDVWNAKDLQDFPVQIVSVSNGKTSRITFEDIKLTAPDESLFVPPANCRPMKGIMGGFMPHMRMRP